MRGSSERSGTPRTPPPPIGSNSASSTRSSIRQRRGADVVRLATRIQEPELMDTTAQARAYAAADFAEPHDAFVARFGERFPDFTSGRVLDLRCGTADVTVRFARAYPAARVRGVDGAQAMLDEGTRAVQDAGVGDRVTLELLRLPHPSLAGAEYDAVVSNSLLHHLADPAVLWATIEAADAAGSARLRDGPASPTEHRQREAPRRRVRRRGVAGPARRLLPLTLRRLHAGRGAVAARDDRSRALLDRRGQRPPPRRLRRDHAVNRRRGVALAGQRHNQVLGVLESHDASGQVRQPLPAGVEQLERSPVRGRVHTAGAHAPELLEHDVI